MPRDDVDLEPLVSTWARQLVARGVTTADRQERQVRALVPDGRPFPASRFTRLAIATHLAALDGSTARRNQHRGSLSVFGSWLVVRGVLDYNPVHGVPAEPTPARPPRILDADEMRALVRAVEPSCRALVAVLYASGVELRAALSLYQRDVLFDRRALRVHDERRPWRDREARVLEWAWTYLTVQCLHRSSRARVFEGLTHRRILDAHAAALRAAGLEHATLRDARHSFAVHCLREGEAPHLVARQLGLRSADRVLALYGPLLGERELPVRPIPRADLADLGDRERGRERARVVGAITPARAS